MMKDCPKCKKCKDCQKPERKKIYPGNFKNFDEFMNDCFRRIIHKPKTPEEVKIND